MKVPSLDYYDTLKKFIEKLMVQSILTPCQTTIYSFSLKPGQQRGLKFYQTGPNAVFLYDTLPAEFTEKSDMHESQGSASSKRKRDSKTACCSQSSFAKWFTRSNCTRSKIIFGIATTFGDLRGKPEATLLTTEYLKYRSSR